MTEPNFEDYPEYGDYDGCEDDQNEEWEFDDCSYGSPGMPAMGTEECDCYCPGSKDCWAIYNSTPDCLSVKALMNEGNEYMMSCPWFYCGKCYVRPGFRSRLTRLKCCFGFLPTSRRRTER